MCFLTGMIGDGVGEDVAAGAAGGSIIPGIGTVVGAVGGLVGGLLGMEGSQNQNAANQQMQIQAEQYDTQMSNTAYQRGMADMKAAGLNPILAYSQGGDSSPSAPTYTATNTLDDVASSAQDMAKLIPAYQDAKDKVQKTRSDTAQANVDTDTQSAQTEAIQAGAQTKVSQAQSASAAANVATATQQATINQASAQSSKAQADAKSAQIDADIAQAGSDSEKKVAPYRPYVDIGAKAAQGASSAIDAVNIFKFLKNMKTLKGNGLRQYDPNQTGTFDKNTGEIHDGN